MIENELIIIYYSKLPKCTYNPTIWISSVITGKEYWLTEYK